MRRDKAATRIFLILSVIHVAAAAPATIRQRSLEVTEAVTPGLEKRANSDDESSHPFSRMDNDLPSTSGILPSQDDTSAAPGDPELHSDPPAELGTPQLQDDLLSTPGAPPSQDDPLPASETPQLHNDQPPTPGAPPPPDDTLPGSGSSQSHDETSPVPTELQSDPPPELGTPQLHIDRPPPTPGTLQLQDDLPPTPGATPSHEGPLPASGTPQLHNDQRLTLGALLSQDDASSASEDLQLHDDWSPWWQHADWYPLEDTLPGESSGLSQLHENPWGQYASWTSSWGTSSTSSGDPELQNDPPPASGTLQPHDDWSSPYRWLYDSDVMSSSSDFDSEAPMPVDSPPALGTPQVHDNPPPASGTPQLDELEEFDSSYRWHNDLRVIEGMSSSSHSSEFNSEAPYLGSEALPSAPETHTFFNDALRQKLKSYAGVGAIAVGLVLGLKRLINHGPYVPLLPTSKRVTNLLTYDLPQSTRWQESCKWWCRRPWCKHSPPTTQNTCFACSR
jgi:hypothetical protein